MQLGNTARCSVSGTQLPEQCLNSPHLYMPILGVLRDSLCVSQNDKKTRNFVVWQMKEFGVHKSWTQLFNIIGDDNFFSWPRFATCLSYLRMGMPCCCQHMVGPKQFSISGEIINKLVDTKIASDIVGCSLTNYIESLVSPVKCQILLCNNILAENI
ncbi:uncharacterized protein LOC130714272 [Lotus japonicus]|uniref:uncharacterized protein LOC130714272 n=1 Tax=Lotus japonicus TaxID=34305 RepID=UPI0025890054|nr:uncharacterized protein LOC130714272 [Lotus japonicus]